MSFDTPRRRPPTNSGSVSRSWAEWTQQLQAYVAWVNSQLRKKPGTKEVKDLRRELQDGTVLVELIEIVANEQIPGAHHNPTNSLEMKENVERVLHFMRSRKIKMHQIRSSDIVEGNMKSIMRLILALAAHFKPSSVKQSSNQQTRSNRSLNIAQEAASALASIKRDADSIKRKMHRPANLDGSGPEETRDYKQRSNRRLSYDQLSPHSSLRQTHSPSNRQTHSPANSPSQNSFRSTSSKSSHDSSSEADLERFSALIDDVDESHVVLLDDTKTARSLLVDLQNVLLNGDELNESLEITENTPSNQQLLIYQSRLQQSEETNNILREELSRIKQECMQLQGMKHGLHQRLTEQQQEILEMKAQALRVSMEREDEEIESLRDDLTEKTTMLNRLHSDLERKNTQLKNIEQELKSSISHRDNIVTSLQSQITELKSQLSSPETVQKSAQEKINFKPFENIDLQGVNDPALLSDLQSVQDILIELCTSSTQQHISLIDRTITKLVNQIKTDNNSHKPTAEVKGHRNLTKRPARPETTKLLCFSSKSVTPSMKSVQKKIGEITLYDFKTTFSPNSADGAQMKYSFKTLDPEFGTVKEEITGDQDILPGWEGKIIGWVEEDYL